MKLRILKKHIPEITQTWRSKYGESYNEGLNFLVSAEEVVPTNLNLLIEQIMKGKPIQQLIGKWSFYNGDYFLNSDVLIPRPETECLVECIKLSNNKFKKILDMGTGSGCIAIELSKIFPKANVYGSDLSDSALLLARKNNLQTTNKVNFFKSDWFENIEGRFDLLVSNPPYIEKTKPKNRDLKFEPEVALFSEEKGLRDIRIIIMNGREYLTKNGWLFIEHGYNQSDAVASTFKKSGYQQIRHGLDLQGVRRFTYAKR